MEDTSDQLLLAEVVVTRKLRKIIFCCIVSRPFIKKKKVRKDSESCLVFSDCLIFY